MLLSFLVGATTTLAVLGPAKPRARIFSLPPMRSGAHPKGRPEDEKGEFAGRR
jgi:hypothetical protein